MAENKTKPTDVDVAGFLAGIPDPARHADAHALCAAMQEVTGEPPTMWGPSIVGFERYRYRYDSGREGEASVADFSPRAKELVIYLPADPPDKDALLARLGKHKAGKCCLYVKRLADVDLEVLKRLVSGSARAIKERYPE